MIPSPITWVNGGGCVRCTADRLGVPCTSPRLPPRRLAAGPRGFEASTSGSGASLLPSPVLQGEILQSNIWKPGPASARERNQFGEVLVQRLDSALGHEAE